MPEIKTWEELTIKDDFIFKKVMQNEIICKKLLEEILNIKIDKIIFPDKEKTIDITYDAKSIRLDVYVKDDRKTVYNIEMQRTNKAQLPPRSRYYQDMIDLELIEKGKDYTELKKSFVIFICTFDPFEHGRYKYTFRNMCDEVEGLELNDGTVKVFLNSKGREGMASKELLDFLKFVEGELAEGEFFDILKAETERVKQSDMWRREYMTLYLHDLEIKKEAREEGRREGCEEGRREGIRALILDNIEEGVPEAKIISKVEKLFDVSEEKAREYIVQCKKIK